MLWCTPHILTHISANIAHISHGFWKAYVFSPGIVLIKTDEIGFEGKLDLGFRIWLFESRKICIKTIYKIFYIFLNLVTKKVVYNESKPKMVKKKKKNTKYSILLHLFLIFTFIEANVIKAEIPIDSLIFQMEIMAWND